MKIANKFLATNKAYLGLGLKSIEVMIVSQVEEFERNGCECYVTNAQFSEMFGESIDKVKRAINRLEELNVLRRSTKFVSGNGKGNRQRTLSVNSRDDWKVNNAYTKLQGDKLEGEKGEYAKSKDKEWGGHNQPIKNKEKNNIKDNKQNRINIIFTNNMKKKIETGVIDEEEFIKEHRDYIDEEMAWWNDEIYFIVEDDVMVCYSSDHAICGEYYYNGIPDSALEEANLV